VTSQLPEDANAAYELVIDGTTEATVGKAMAAAICAACLPGIIQVTAGNYGGKLGPYHLYLHQLLKEYPECA
jgi:formylmethanofuran--tetrahydromethanopterin N-formyltransferase